MEALEALRRMNIGVKAFKEQEDEEGVSVIDRIKARREVLKKVSELR